MPCYLVLPQFYHLSVVDDVDDDDNDCLPFEPF